MTREIIIRRPGQLSLRVLIERRGLRRRAAIRAMRRGGMPVPAIAVRLHIEIECVERALRFLAMRTPATARRVMWGHHDRAA